MRQHPAHFDLDIRASVAALIVLLAAAAQAQTSQFLFDETGNLTVQMADTIFPPQITGQPQNQVVETDEPAAFSVVVADPRAITYQWRFNGTNLIGETGVALLLKNVATNNEGQYQVVLTNPSGSITSAPALLWIDNDGDGLGDSWELAHFGNLNQNATSDFDHDGLSNIREFQDGTDPTDPNSARYYLLVVRDGGAVTRNPDQTGYDKGTTVTLTATASSNELFHAWLGDVVTRDNPVTLVMTNDKTVYARFTPIAFTWIGPSGNWEDAANWSPQLAPGLDDSVLINSGVAVTLNTNAICEDVTLVDNSPTLTGSGTLTVRGNLFWAAGSMNGSGRTVIEAGGILNVVNPSGVSASLNTRTLENGGAILWTGTGNITMNSGAVITNRPGALFHAQNAATIVANVGSSRIDNAGTFRKSASTGTTTIASGINFNNSGTVDIQTGALSLNGGGTHSGSFTVPTGTALNLSGNHNANSSSSITGAGQFQFSGNGDANLAGLVNVGGNYTFTGNGTANFTGNTICTNNTVTISGATANFNGMGLVSPAFVTLSNGTLGGTSPVTINTAMIWSAGSLNDAGRLIIAPGATLNIVNPTGIGALLNTHTLENGGTVFWTGTGNIAMNFGAVITNRPGALFHAQNAATIVANVGSSRIDNAGAFRKSTSTGTTTIASGINFNNSGTVDIQTGALSLNGGGTHSGNFTVPTGTTLNLSGNHNANSSSSITGAGQFQFSGNGDANLAGLVNVGGNYTFTGNGTANFTGNTICTNNTVTISGATANFNGMGLVSPAFVTLSNGTIGGTSPVTINTAMIWSAGSMNDGGRLIIAPEATLNIVNPTGVGALLNTRTLENGGTVLWTGTGSIAMNSGAVITNRLGALFHVLNAASFVANVGSGRIDNAGTFRKSGNTGATSVSLFGGITFNNYGTVDIRSGILAANGGYTSTGNALLNCVLSGIAPGTGYGQLQVAGSVTLAGNLSVALANNFVPPVNSLYTVLSAGTRNGTFTSFSYPSNAAAMQLSNTPNSVIVRATNVFIVPQPAPVPAGLISWWRAEGNALDTFGTNHGVLTNGATFAAGQVGQTFALDGADDYVQVPDSQTLRPVSVTIETWVKFFATNGIRIVLVKPLGNNTTFDSYGLALQDGAVLAAICDNGGFGPFLAGPANTVTGKWYHLAYTFDDSSKQQVLYVDGIPVASGTANKTIGYDTHPLLLGADVENGVLGFFHNGLIDEASLYNRALTRDEVVTIYNAGVAGKQLPVTLPPAPLLLPPELIGTDIKLTWTAVSNATYRLEFNSGLNLTNWNVLAGDVLSLSNTASKLDALTLSNRFYRVRVIP